MINIAFIINQMWGSNGGTEGQLLMLIDSLDRSTFRPHLICLGGTPWTEKTKLHCPTLILNNRRLISPATPIGVLRLRRYLVENAIDVAQTFFLDADLFGVTAAHLANVPVIVASRRNIGHFNNAKSYWMLKRIGRWVSYYLCNSRAAAQMAIAKEDASPDKTRVIYNGLDLDRFSADLSAHREKQRAAWGIEAGEILVGLTAHLRHVKNVPALISAAANLIPEFSNLRFVVVGEGPLHRELDEMAASRGLGNRFKLVGAVQDIVPCLAAFDIGVLCSHAESFSNALIEYMAAGLPIVASDVGGNGEAIMHQKTGLLYAPNDPSGLQVSLRNLVTNISSAKGLGTAAREIAFARYSREAALSAHARFYEEVSHRTRGAELTATRN